MIVVCVHLEARTVVAALLLQVGAIATEKEAGERSEGWERGVGGERTGYTFVSAS